MSQDKTSGLLANQLQIPGLELAEELGSGYFSVIYRARKDQQQVAVKVIKEARYGSLQDLTTRFLREGVALARLRHPSLVNIFEVGKIDQYPYLVMEFIEGKTLAAIIEQRMIPEGSIVATTLMVAGALAEVHRHGLVHRDVKPANIIVQPDGRAKLVDFGLVAPAGKENTNNEIVGSFLYSAPEQNGVVRRPVDGRSDLYSLGIMMFQAATGRPPFEAKDLGELIRQHAVQAVPNVCERNPSISPALAGIIVKLLAKDPDDRYQSANGLIADLQQLDSLNQTVSIGRDLLLGAEDYSVDHMHETNLVGREHEISTLRGAWKQACDASGGIFLLEGEPGAGKSRLVRELLRDVRMEKTAQTVPLILQGKCSKGDPMPFAPLRDGIELYLHLVARLPTDKRAQAEQVLRDAAGDSAPLLKLFSPDLAKVLGDTKAMNLTEAGDQFFQALVDFFTRLAEIHRGMLIFVDDIQWLDDASRKVFKAFATRMAAQDPCRLLVVVAARNDPDSAPALERFAAETKRAITGRFTIGPLPEQAVLDLVRELLGGYEIDRAFVGQMASRMNGSPFAVGEYVRAMTDAGLLRFAWGQWLVDAQGLEQLALPTDVIQLVLKRLDDLSDATRQVLTAAAVIGIRVHADILPQICGMETKQIMNAFGEALQARLIERSDVDEYVFIHDRIREALLSGLTSETRAHTHQTIAEVMDQMHTKERTDGAASDDFIYALAYHYSRGETAKSPLRVHDACYRAGRRGIENFAYEDAYHVLNQALGALQLAAVKPSDVLLRSLGECCFRLFRIQEGVKHLEAALELTNKLEDRIATRLLLLRIYTSTYQGDDALAQAYASFEDFGHPLPTDPKKRMKQAKNYYLMGKLGTRFPWLIKKASPAERPTYDTLVLLNNWMARAAFFNIANDVIVEASLRNMLMSYKAQSPKGFAICLKGFSAILAMTGRPAEGRAAIAKAVHIAERLGDRIFLGECKIYESLVAHFGGDPIAARQLSKDALRHHGGWMDLVNFDAACITILYVCLWEGHWSEMTEWLDRTRDKITPGDIAAESWYLLRSAAVASALGQVTEAYDFMQQATKLSLQVPENRVHWMSFVLFRMLYLLNMGEFGAPVDEVWEQYQKHCYTTPTKTIFHGKFVYVAYAHVRLAETMRADAAARPAALAKLDDAMFEFEQCSQHPQVLGHYLMIAGAVQFLKGDHKGALDLLARAEEEGNKINSDWVILDVYRFRAHVFNATNRPQAAERLAISAHEIAVRHGFVAKSRELKAEFKIAEQTGWNSANTTVEATARLHANSSTSAGGGYEALMLRRQLKALIDVSLASASVFDPDQQARVALDEIVRILTAERAFLFLCDQDSPRLTLKCGRDQEGNELDELKGYSASVVERVRAERQPVIVTGSEAGGVSRTESVITHNLRSILAAPLMTKDRLIGVVYLDNRLAKGVFTPDDVEILQALSNQIAVSIETARAAKLEFEKLELGRENKIIKEMSGKMRNILDHIEQGILTFDAEMRIDSEFSAFLAKLYRVDPQVICGAHVMRFVFRGASLSADDLNVVHETLKACIGEDMISWELNSSNLAAETVVNVNGDDRFIALAWTPILGDDGYVQRVMLSIQDLTQQRVLEAEVSKQKNERQRLMAIIAELIPQSRARLRHFFKDTAGRLERSLGMKPGAETIDLLFRELHTIKGGSRSLGLKGLANATHAVEDLVQRLRQGEALDPVLVQQGLAALVKEHEAYQNTFVDVLGGQASQSEGADDLKAEPSLQLLLATQHSLIKTALREGGCELVELACHDRVVHWQPDAFTNLGTMLTHALNNCVDHGYILPTSRGANFKSAYLEVSARQVGQQVEVSVIDHGAGFDFAKLRELAGRRGLAHADDPLDVLFHDGVSTAEQVTLSSGRGVGLAAIRAMAREAGGDAVMTAPQTGGSCLLITLPAATTVLLPVKERQAA